MLLLNSFINLTKYLHYHILIVFELFETIYTIRQKFVDTWSESFEHPCIVKRTCVSIRSVFFSIHFFVLLPDLSRAGRLTLNRALDLITYLKSETHNVPLLQGIGYLESFYKMIEKRNIADVTQNLKVFRHQMSDLCLLTCLFGC